MNAVNFYQEQIKRRLSTIPLLAQCQEKSLHELDQQGFPNHHHEDWKYTKLDALLQRHFSVTDASNQIGFIPSNLPVENHIIVHNGEVLGIDRLPDTLPSGVFVLPILLALQRYENKLKPYFDKILKHEHGFHALNTALAHTGVVIYVPAGVCLETPIAISHWQDREQQAVHSRHLLCVEAGAQASVIEDYRGAEACEYFSNTVTEIYVGEGSQLSHYKIQREGRLAYHVGQVAVNQEENSQFFSHSFSLGGRLVRSDTHIRFLGEKARCLMNGIYLPTENQHMDHHTTVLHDVANCHSEQDYKGIVADQARAVFNGKIIVAKHAQHTEAKQQNKNLLLGGKAEVSTKPQLEIFADDVICSHGATVGQLDDEALFYLATRGITRSEASNYLLQAFIEANVRLISDKPSAAWIKSLIEQQLRSLK